MARTGEAVRLRRGVYCLPADAPIKFGLMSADPVGNLQKARAQLVKQRRSYVAQIASGSSNDEQVAEAMAQIVEIQQCIKAIDDAIFDEQRDAERPRSRPGLQIVVDKDDPEPA
jgi:transposase